MILIFLPQVTNLGRIRHVNQHVIEIQKKNCNNKPQYTKKYSKNGNKTSVKRSVEEVPTPPPYHLPHENKSFEPQQIEDEIPTPPRYYSPDIGTKVTTPPLHEEDSPPPPPPFDPQCDNDDNINVLSCEDYELYIGLMGFEPNIAEALRPMHCGEKDRTVDIRPL